MGDCIFCRIVAGDAPASVVHRDERCVAFMDIRPVNPGHLLVVPTRHAAHLVDTDAETVAHLTRVAHRLAAAIRASGLRCEGVNLHLADGAAAGQDVFHVHLHVIPRWKGDGFGLRFAPGYGVRPRAELDAAADAVRATLSPPSAR